MEGDVMRLERQVRALTAEAAENRNWALRERARAEKTSNAAEMLAEFHAALGGEPGQGGAGLRTSLHCEEHAELLAELHNLRSLEDGGVALSGVPGSRERLARELADVVYVAYGTAYMFDVDLEAALAEVHRAAMSKVRPVCVRCEGGGEVAGFNENGPAIGICPACKGTGEGKRVVREDGKVCKPPGFVPPDMSAAIGYSRRAEA
jgi:NTP pyrophosphatase (non-canonical NTP hydrolase)